MRMKRFVLPILVLIAIALVILVAGPIIRSHTPVQAHSWISNFGGGLLLAIVATAVITRLFVNKEQRLLTPTRVTFALVGFLLLVIFLPNVNCQVRFGPKVNPIVCK
jgi:drug/metabolite transporter (DMT)-like permease